VPDSTKDLEEALPAINWRFALSVPIGKQFGNDLDAIGSLVEQGDIQFAIGIGIDFTDDLPINFEIPEPATIALLLCGLPLLKLRALGSSQRARVARFPKSRTT
jgi:hypothetical protein